MSNILFVSYQFMVKYYVGQQEYYENNFREIYLEDTDEPWDEEAANDIKAKIESYLKFAVYGEKATFNINIINFKSKPRIN